MDTNQKLLYKILKKAENNNTSNKCFISICDYLSENDIVFYKKHYQVIFSHEFLKAFFRNGVITSWNIHLTNDIVGLYFSDLFDSRKFIKLYGDTAFSNIQKIRIPYIGGQVEGLNNCIPTNPQFEFFECFKKEYQNIVSCQFANDWKEYAQQMILKENPLKYLEEFLKT